MSHTEYSAQFVQYSSVFLGLEEAPKEQLPCTALMPVLPNLIYNFMSTFNISEWELAH
jgi:hypothetical protein